MEEQGQNKTTSIEIKEESNEDITIQLDYIKEEVLDEGEKNCEILRDKTTIVENQQHHQINNNDVEKTAEQVPSCSTNFHNPDYPGFIVALRQAKKKKKKHDVSIEILFSCLPESVIKQHDFNLNEWWNYCLVENKDPLETDLSVAQSYIRKKLDAGASPDDMKSISSTLCLIASDEMERQMYSSSFLFSEFAKYSAVNDTDGYKTPKSSCQNDSIISSLHTETKKQDESKKASVQIENVKSSKLPELIDLSDNDSHTKLPSTLLKKSQNNNEPTNLKKNGVFSQKAIDSSQLMTPLIKTTLTKPPKELMPGSINGQQTQVNKVLENNTENQQKKIVKTSPQVPSIIKMNNAVVDNESDLINKKSPTITMPILKQQQDKVIQQQQSTLSAANNNQENNLLKKNIAPSTSGNLKSGSSLVNEVQKSQQHQQQLLANNTHLTDSLTKTTVIESLIPSKNLPVHQECSSKALDQKKVEASGNSQSGSLLVDTVRKEQQQKNQLPPANQAIDTSTKTLTPAIKHATPVKPPVHHNTQPSTPCEINTSVSKSQTELQLSNAVPKNKQQVEILEVPSLEDKTEIVQVLVQYQDIYKVLIFIPSKPVLFFYTNTKSASKIRQILGMNNPKRPYFDPADKDQTHKRIILFPKLLKGSSINTLKKLFSSNACVKELSAKEAYATLLKCALRKKPNNSSNIDETQTTISTTNTIVKNSTIHSAAPAPPKSNDSNESLTKAKCAKLSCINKDTNVNNKNNEKSNDGNDKLTNNDSRQQTSPVVIEKTKLDQSQSAQNDEFDKQIASNNNIKIITNSDNTFSNTICLTLKSKNLLSLDKNHTISSDNNSQGSIDNKINNNKRKHSQLEITAEEENLNKILPSQK
ncbi:hypothetical protein HCN44_007101 [Aphidius gifuensis]|uniref:Uncharacterized protein n=1 Tax=Aphidius gifuensis TaxID=684658 RepID=A0A834XMN7_APHGI|nr:hypothetical protein HCN44_007101 [Aphidius gifuensis]